MKELETPKARDMATIVQHKADNARDTLGVVANTMSGFKRYSPKKEELESASEELGRAEAYVAECRKTLDKLDTHAAAVIAEREKAEATFN